MINKKQNRRSHKKKRRLQQAVATMLVTALTIGNTAPMMNVEANNDEKKPI